MTLRPENVFAGRRWHHSPEDDPSPVTCPTCGEDVFDAEPCDCTESEMRRAA
jgi:hypothetical protein